MNVPERFARNALFLLLMCGKPVAAAAGCVEDCVRRRQMQAMPMQAIGAICQKECAEASVTKSRLLLTNHDGKVIGVLRPDGAGFKVHDAAGRLAGKISFKADLLRLSDAKGAELWQIKRRDGGAEIASPSGERRLRIKAEEGRLKLEDFSGKELAEFRAKDDGYEVRRTDSRSFATVKPQDHRLLFETTPGWPSGPMGLPASLEGSDDARAGVWFCLTSFSLPEQAALFVYFREVQRR